MSVRMRHTKGHTGNRRSHHALKLRKLVVDATSGALRLPHRLDETTGMYRGKQLFAPKTKAAKQEAKNKKEVKHEHGHKDHEHEVEGSKGLVGKITGAMRPKARSGAGGGGV